MIAETNIKRLIEQCRKNDWKAQKELYLLYADQMMSLAIRYSPDLSAAKDLVQETFLTFFNKIEKYDADKGTPAAWISRILINQALKDYRKNKKTIYLEEEVFTNETSLETSILELLKAEDILKLLNDLPAGCRIIFNLKEIEGFSHNEISNMLNITASASRSQLTRAKKILRTLINSRASKSQQAKYSLKTE